MDIKVLAFVCMLVDHVAAVFLPPGPSYYACRVVGRLAFPLFVYGVVRGYCHTSDVGRYAMRLFLSGVISQAPYVAAFGVRRLNVMFELCGILLVISCMGRPGPRRLAALVAGLWLCGLSEYGVRGLLFGVSLFLFRRRPRLRLLAGFLFAGCLNTGFYRVSAFAVPLAEVMVGKNRGRRLPRGFYLLYPAHLAAVAMARGIAARWAM